MNFNLNELTNLKNVYISSEDFCRINNQSCDCVSLIADNGEKLIALEHCKGDVSSIEAYEIAQFDKEKYKHRLLMESPITLEKINYAEGGRLIDAIKFKCNDAFLFVFADEYNLILTKSKYDLLDDVGEILDVESTLDIVCNA